MSDTLVKIVLGPVLLAQGLYTRRVTPKLPEARGQRRGIEGQGPALRLLIVGDSAAAGVGVDHQREALAGQLVSHLSMRHTVNWVLLAQTGFNTQQVLQMLKLQPAEPFDVVVVSVGVNDVTSSLDDTRWLAQQQQLLDLIAQRFGTTHIILTPVPPMHLFPALPHPLRWYLGRRARRFNAQLHHLAKQADHCMLLHNPLPVSPDAMASDGFHPGAAIYALWAQNVAQAITRRIG